ncbi:chondroitinase-B domain-containing protein [Flavobacterium nackdongense]|uniref:Alginate lyase n=1 Tax=Flavobacterium nackdongense TaxID=2547394 RepID=A0A4P6Y5N4_9FLAO|nr:chondroitinase-B domain-containing protein [Flavobacterium nackdongense]QBN17459.1 alginate lyase [Flavobacterium nackdongense]
MKNIKIISLVVLLFSKSLSYSIVRPEVRVLVHNVKEFNIAVAQAKAGHFIVLSNGIWKNAELLFEGMGTSTNPITLTAEEKGKVILSGASNLRIAGEYLVVEGLVFKNGFTPTTELISFRKDSKKLANHCRLTQCVIDHFSNPERFESDYWISIYGKNNRIDHNHIEGKQNLGVTMAVRLETEESQENNHQIDHNYFGPRPNLGSNGGETIRIGTSHYSLTNSRTVVEFNYFDRCDGEGEIVSNKSCRNTYRFNTFFECAGSLTLRHGSGTLVDGNVFIGNNKPFIGGIRVINGDQTVINNYCVGLTGYRFRGALVIMNGVPNSTPNRYHQVKNAVIKNNTFVNCDHVQLCAGSDKERSATPINSNISDNIFFHQNKSELFTVYDDISGISFAGNYTSPNINTEFSKGFLKVNFKLVKDKNGFELPESKALKVKVLIHPEIATKSNSGVSWYSKAEKNTALSSGKIIRVEPGLDALYDAALASAPGDIIELTSSETYYNTKMIAVKHPLTFRSNQETKPKLIFEKKTLFEIENGGSLALEGLQFDGKEAPDYAGNSVISTSKYSMIKNYELKINRCDFINLDVNHSFDVITVYKNTFADLIQIENATFKKISGNIIALDKETDDVGIYNAENVILENNSFSDIGGAVLQLYRGGTDESTNGPILTVSHCVFDNVGKNTRNRYNASLSLYGVQVNHIENNIFNNSKGIKMHLVVGEPIVNIFNNNFFKTDPILVNGDEKFIEKNSTNFDPKLKENYQLSADSPLINKGTDGSNIGLIQK